MDDYTWLYMLIGFFFGSIVLYVVIRRAVGDAINDALTASANQQKVAEMRARQSGLNEDWG